jgi:hypothetical protein
MKSKILPGTLFALCAANLPAASEPSANLQKVSFPSGSGSGIGDTATGSLALRNRLSGSARRLRPPSPVVVIQEWWGVNDWVKERK